MKIEIKCRFTAKVLFSHECKENTIRLTVEAAIKAGANLDGAYLAGANLDGANLDGAYLAGANLAGAYLAGAYLDGAHLDGAYLAGAYLDGAHLDGAYLARANLDGGEKLIGERPIFQIGPIGSRSAYFVAYVTDKGLRLRAGCFFGDKDAFEEKLAECHAGNVHCIEYKAAMELICAHAELWTPKDAEIEGN